MKKIISSVLAAAMLISAFTAYAAAPQTPSDGSFDIAYIGSESSKAWQEALTGKLDESMDTVTGIYTTAATMQEAQLNISQIKAANPDMVVIDASIAKSTENQYFESILLSLFDLDELPYVAYVTDEGFTSTDTIRQIMSNFGGEWLSLADAENASSAEDYAAYLASGFEYKKLTVPSPNAKLSSYSSDMSPVSQFSGTLTDETQVINTYGNYVIVKTSASSGTYAISVDGMSNTVNSVGSGISFSKYDYGDRKHEIVITAVGEVTIEGIYSEPEGIKNSIKLGFEDNDLTAVSHNGNGNTNNSSFEWVDGGANGSRGALHATKLTSNGEVNIPFMFKYGTKYKVSAKVKVITEGVTSMSIFAYQKRFKDDDSANTITSGHTWITSAISNLTSNEWTDISATFDIKETSYAGSSSPTTITSEYGEIAIRLGGDASSEFYIDDIVIEPVNSDGNAIYSLDMDFEDESVSPGVPQTYSQLSFVKGAGEDGGTVLQTTAYSNQIINISNVYIVPNRHYTISYKIRGISDNSVGKNSKLIIDRSNKHFNSEGETATEKLPNYEYKGSANITKEWQTITEDYVVGNKIIDDMGLCSLYFKLFNDDSSNDDKNSVPNTDKITIQIDDLKIIPNEMIYNGDFESDFMPPVRYSTKLSIVPDNSINGELNHALKIVYTKPESSTDEGTGDMSYYPAIECGTSYKLSFKIKGEEEADNRLQLIFSGYNRTIDENNDYLYLSPANFSNEWIEYSTVFTYTPKSGLQKFPLLLIRPVNSGTIYIDDLKIEKINTEGLYNIQLNGDMMSGERSEITFSDYLASNKGYVYTIYALDSSKNKTIYAYGETADTVIKFNNFANPGTQLYADIVYVNEAGVYSSEYTVDLGIVGGDAGECVITAAFSADSDMMSSIKGQVDVSNNGQSRTVMVGVATYGETMNLLSFDVDEYEITPYMNKTFELTVYPDAELAYYAKVFAWDALSSMIPYCSSDIIEY